MPGKLWARPYLLRSSVIGNMSPMIVQLEDTRVRTEVSKKLLAAIKAQ